MNSLAYKEEAEDCRQKALAYLGRPEATLLLRVAREFDRLARTRTGNATRQTAVAGWLLD